MSVQPPPIYQAMVGPDGKVTLPWILFFSQEFSGDSGTAWTPTFSGLTETGTPTFTGFIYKISSSLVYFRATITPATNTSSVAGTTYISNFPLTIKNDGACFAVANNTGDNAGMAASATQRIYTPVWTTVSSPVTITGILEAS